MANALETAIAYIARGWNAVPVPYRTKKPVIDGWQARVINADNASQYFNGQAQNIGVALGATSRGLTDIDLDCHEAIAIAPYLLPPTRAIFGRASKRASHWLYTTDLANQIDQACVVFNEPTTKQRLLEVRIGGGGKGAQTIFPGSVHEGGEPITWEETGEPAAVDGNDLTSRCALVAATCLIARTWPIEGGRHDAALTVGGFLRRANLSETQIAVATQAIARAAGDTEWKDRVNAAKDHAQYHDQTQQGRGFPKLVELVGEPAANKIAEWLGYSDTRQRYADAASPPVAPPQTISWPELPEQALHGLAGDVVTALAPQTESDPVALLLQYLISFGNAVGRGPYYQIESDKHFTNLFAVLASQSSKARKGTSAGRIRAIMQVADQEWTARCCQGGMSSGEGVIWAIRDPIYKIKKGEQELDDPGITDKRLLLDEREFFQALAVMKREGSILSRVVRDAWDGRDYIASLTKHSPARTTEPMISILGHITEEELRRNLDHTSMANGYANRFLFACVRRARLLPHGGTLDSDTVQRLGIDTGRVLRAAGRISRVTMTPAAAHAWEVVYAALSEGQPGLLGAITGRGEAQTIRLAMIYALLDGTNQIDLPHLEAALSVWEFCEASAKHIFGDLIGEPLADEILRSLRGVGPEGMTRTDLHRLFNRHQTSASIGAALGILMAAGKVRREQRTRNRSMETGGRPVEVWVAT